MFGFCLFFFCFLCFCCLLLLVVGCFVVGCLFCCGFGGVCCLFGRSRGWALLVPNSEACHNGKHQLQAQSKQQPVLAHGRAQHRCKPQRRTPSASTQQAATCAGSQKSPAPMQATKASNSCKHRSRCKRSWLTQSPAPIQATQASNSCKHKASG